ncbi:MAG: heavy-metal-associated domain-containing protein [Nitrososphaerota archaeon]|nr:heavy-metal-associated domain-containing protein [Nitrososphaerota archaeon]
MRRAEKETREPSAVLSYPRGKSRNVEKSLRKLAGVRQIEFNYPTSKVKVTFDSTTQVEGIIRAVRRHNPKARKTRLRK